MLDRALNIYGSYRVIFKKVPFKKNRKLWNELKRGLIQSQG